MRIVQLLSVGTTNGAARHCLALCGELAGRGHEVLLFHRKWLDVAAVEAAGVRCVEFEYHRTPREFRRALGLLRGHGAEVVHTHMSAAHAYGVMLRFLGGPPVVATAHARHLQLHWAFNDLVIAPSETTARYHRRVNLVAARRMRVIPSFLGAQSFEPATPARRRRAREQLGLPPNALVIGQLADIHFEKRQSDLLAAVWALAGEHPNVAVALMGGRIERGELRRVDRATSQMGERVRFFHRGGDVGRFLDALDIFAISSVREEGPIAAIEAMSAGLPIVSTRVGRMEELTATGAGLLVAPRDVAALTGALGRLAADPELRRAMGRAARQRALAEHDQTAAVDRMEAALAGVARAPRHAAPAADEAETPAQSTA